MASKKKKVIEGKYFTLRGHESGLLLSVRGSSDRPGTQVEIADEEDECDGQMWYENPVEGTICSKIRDLALTLTEDNTVIVDSYQEDNDRQKWQLDSWSGTLKNSADLDLLMEVTDRNVDRGSPVGAAQDSGEPNQKWSVKRIPIHFFMLVSEFSELCMEAEAAGFMGKVKPGAKIITGPKDQKDNQLWYEDSNGILRSKVKHMGLTCQKSQGASMKVEAYDEDDEAMQWQLGRDGIIQNRSRPDNVVDIKDRKASKGAGVVVWQFNGQNNQQWNRVKVTVKSKKSKKGSGSDDDSDEDSDD